MQWHKTYQLHAISIHAPARGATFRISGKVRGFVISIHAPARGATCVFSGIAITAKNFNPRSREGSDCVCYRALTYSSYISIHAPARGATFRMLKTNISQCDFNPRSREGSDRTSLFRPSMDCYFNPRSREGSDCKFHQKYSNYSQKIWL